MPYKDPEQRKAYKAAYYLAHREETIARTAAWQGAHRDEVAAKTAARYAANPAPAKVRAATWHAAHREEANERRAAYYAAHREEHRATSAIWQATHQDEIKATKVAYYRAHRNEIKAKVAAWKRANPEKVRENHRTSKALRRGARGCAHDACLVIGPTELAWQLNPHVCYICGTLLWQGVNLHMDHVVPVVAGGVHCADNLRPCCAVCNSSKKGRTLEEFLRLRDSLMGAG
jgi:5-methylcytosine-specific restriction endonuclease McrA